jgi:hypothetical protein
MPYVTLMDVFISANFYFISCLSVLSYDHWLNIKCYNAESLDQTMPIAVVA